MSTALDLVRGEAERARSRYSAAFDAEYAYATEHHAWPAADHPLARNRQMLLGFRAAVATIEHVLSVAEGDSCTFEGCPCDHADEKS